MSEPRRVKIRVNSEVDQEVVPEVTPGPSHEPDRLPREVYPEVPNSVHSRLNRMLVRPYRNPILHWAAFVISVISLAPLIYWLANPQSLPVRWVQFDILLSAFFIIEFFTRSGFRRDPAGYIRSRFFDFFAMVPALVLVYYGVVWETGWVWIILALRLIRMVDRLLGDDFFTRNALALAEGFEEEITDRVMLRIMARIQADLDRGKFGVSLAGALEDNREGVLNRVRAQHPREGIGVGLAHIVGLDAALERAEAHTFDAVVEVLKSPEVDTTIRESVNSAFSVMRKEIAVKTWRQHLGIHIIPHP